MNIRTQINSTALQQSLSQHRNKPKRVVPTFITDDMVLLPFILMVFQYYCADYYHKATSTTTRHTAGNYYYILQAYKTDETAIFDYYHYYYYCRAPLNAALKVASQVNGRVCVCLCLCGGWCESPKKFPFRGERRRTRV